MTPMAQHGVEAQVMREAKCRGMAELYYLSRLHEQASQQVQLVDRSVAFAAICDRSVACLAS